MILDWPGITNRIGILMTDAKQVADENRRKTLIVIGVGAVLVMAYFVFRKIK
jgi:hypothetical protein